MGYFTGMHLDFCRYTNHYKHEKFQFYKRRINYFIGAGPAVIAVRAVSRLILSSCCMPLMVAVFVPGDLFQYRFWSTGRIIF